MKTAAALIAAGMLLTVAGTATALAGTNFLLLRHDHRFDGATWCASGLSSDGGGRDCAFFSFEQCRATVSGLGGICYPSPYAAAYDGPRHQRKRAHKRHY